MARVNSSATGTIKPVDSEKKVEEAVKMKQNSQKRK